MSYYISYPHHSHDPQAVNLVTFAAGINTFDSDTLPCMLGYDLTIYMMVTLLCMV